MLSRGQTDTLPGAPRQILEAGLAAHLPGFLAHDRCAASPHAEPPAELAANETTDAATVSSHAQPEEGCAPAVRRRQINFRLRGRAHRVAPGTLSLTLDRASERHSHERRVCVCVSVCLSVCLSVCVYVFALMQTRGDAAELLQFYTVYVATFAISRTRASMEETFGFRDLRCLHSCAYSSS